MVMRKSRLQPRETVKSQELFVAASWIKLLVQQVRLPNGGVLDDYGQLSLLEYAVVFGPTTDGRVIMER